jgi:hypothetical protein
MKQMLDGARELRSVEMAKNVEMIGVARPNDVSPNL